MDQNIIIEEETSPKIPISLNIRNVKLGLTAKFRIRICRIEFIDPVWFKPRYVT